MASKLFNKLGVGRKHKSVDLEPTVFSEQSIAQQIEACVEYSLPPDCEEDDDVYREPADSLNTISSSTSSTHSHSASTRGTSDCDTLPTLSISSTHSDSSTKQSGSAGCNAQLTDNVSNVLDMDTCTHPAPSTVDTTTEHMQSDSTQLDTSIAQLHLSDDSTMRPDMAESCSADDTAFAVYMNDSQIKAAKAGAHKPGTVVPKLNPEVDPRNAAFAGAGNEYESPWDLESEIIQVVKQMQNTSSVSTSSTQSLLSHKSESNQPAKSTAGLATSSMSRTEPTPGHKVDYDSMTGPLHKVKQPNAHRQQSSARTNTSASAVPAVGGVKSVLVEGQWREAKPLIPVVESPSSPELASLPQIVSQPVSRTGTNSATNLLYDKSNASDIKVMLRYSEEKKHPCAQPRNSLSTSPPSTGDQVYQNMTVTKKSAAAKDYDGVYDDPWNVEQVQQEIFDQLERQKQKTLTNESKHRRGSDELPAERQMMEERFALPKTAKRPTDLPSEGSSFGRPADMVSRRLMPSNSVTSDKMDKLSPRALPSATKATGVPQIPQTSPGQLHANKPVLVVHKNSYPYSNNQERKGSISSSRSGSTRKTPGTPSDGSEQCIHRVGLSVNKKLPVTQQPWYHGAIQRFQAEDLLRTHPDGSFLIRESSNSPRDKTLSLKNLSGFIHIKISHQPDGTVVLGQFSHPFKSIMEMVEYYSRHKVNIRGAEHTYLEIPVIRDG